MDGSLSSSVVTATFGAPRETDTFLGYGGDGEVGFFAGDLD
jgi:hypothetical protein